MARENSGRNSKRVKRSRADAGEYEVNSEARRDNERFNADLSRHHVVRYVGIVLLIILVVGLVIYWFGYRRSQPFSYASVNWETDIVTAESQQYTPFSDGVLQYSTNGATFYNEASKTAWSASYDMSNPAVAVNDNYAVIYDQGAKTAVVLNAESGSMGSILTELAITKATISAYGVSAFIVEEDLSNNMLFFDKYGSQLDIEIKTLMSESGYPMDISFSPDGQMMIASFVYIDSGVMQNRIVFYSFDTTVNTSSHAVAAFQKYGDTLFVDVEFLGDDRAAAFGDGKIVIYSVKNNSEPQELITIEPEETITNLAYNDKYIAFSTENGDLVQSKILYLYNSDGTMIFDETTSFDFESLYLGEQGVYLIGSSTVQYRNLKGQELFTGSLECNILQLVSPGKGTELLVVSNQALKSFKLKR